MSPDRSPPASPTGRLGKADICVFSVIEEEFEAITEVFGLNFFKQGYGYILDPATNTNRVVFRQSSGRFSLPAAGSISAVVRDYFPDVFIIVGIAGGVSRHGVKLGDVIVPNYIHYSEPLKIVDGVVNWRHVPYDHPSTYILGEAVQDAARKKQWQGNISYKRPARGNPQLHLGSSLIAGDKIWGSVANEEQIALLARFDDAIGVETESAGIARAVFEARGETNHNVQYVVTRGISDLIDKAANQSSRDAWRRYAAHAAATFARSVVDEVSVVRRTHAFLPMEVLPFPKV
jgi:nucleoside phosphorylase